LLVLLSFFVVVEIVLSSTHLFGARKSWTSPDALIGWRYKPHARFWYDGENDHVISGRINNHGWRDRDRELAKPEGGIRVAVLGDSFVEAFQVETDSMFTQLLEKRLQQRYRRPVEVLNFGRSGMSQTEQLLTLRRDALSFSPDIVALVFVPTNDVDDISPRTTDDVLRPFYRTGDNTALILDTGFVEHRSFLLKRVINPFKQQSALVSLVTERYNLLRRSQRRVTVTAADGASGITGAMTLCTDTPDPVFEANYRLCKRIIEEMALSCRDHDRRLLLVCADWVYQTDDLAARTEDDPSFDMHFFERDLGVLADSLGVDYVGLQSVFEDHYRAYGRPLHWEHWNYAGHRLVSDALAAKLETMITEDDKR
jgi:hypothetical protein